MAGGAIQHVLLFPFPAQGHVPPMLKLGELLSLAGLHVTFLNTEHIHDRLLRSSPAVDRLAQRPNFRFRTISDGLPQDDPRSMVYLLDLEESLRTRSREQYRDMLLAPDGQEDPDGWPTVSCVVADGILTLGLEVPEELGIPVFLLRTSSACSVWAYYSIRNMLQIGELPFPEEANMDELVQGVAGMESFLRRRDLPGLVRRAKSTTDRMLGYLNTFSGNLSRASALILNTCEFLEAPVLSHIRSTVCPITYTVGPLHHLVKDANSSFQCNNGQGVDNNNVHAPESSSSIFPGLWKEDRSCMVWLDAQPDKSVVYVSFGSVAVVSREALVEFQHGLVNSGHRFLWVIRPDLVEGGAGAAGDTTQPEVEIKVASERGYLVGWAPQEEVLGHPAVGCFLTHSGWNSTLESVVKGVPMICWPFFADQQINSRFVGKVWNIGVDMKDMNGRVVVEEMVRKLMDGNGNDELRRSAGKMAEEMAKSCTKGGSSYMNFQKLLQHIKSFHKTST